MIFRLSIEQPLLHWEIKTLVKLTAVYSQSRNIAGNVVQKRVAHRWAAVQLCSLSKNEVNSMSEIENAISYG